MKHFNFSPISVLNITNTCTEAQKTFFSHIFHNRTYISIDIFSFEVFVSFIEYWSPFKMKHVNNKYAIYEEKVNRNWKEIHNSLGLGPTHI